MKGCRLYMLVVVQLASEVEDRNIFVADDGPGGLQCLCAGLVFLVLNIPR